MLCQNKHHQNGVFLEFLKLDYKSNIFTCNFYSCDSVKNHEQVCGASRQPLDFNRHWDDITASVNLQ